MRIIHIGALSIGAFALIALTGPIALAQSPAEGVLSTLEVRQLVARAEPHNHSRLSAHFAALAERYIAEAKRHASMSQGFVGNPNRVLGKGVKAHCSRLSELNTQSAATVRELAAHHERLAAGAPSIVPANGARFEQGARATPPTDKELIRLAANASTPSEHLALDDYFLGLAQRYTADAAAHAQMAQAYWGTRIPTASAHCDRLVTQSRDAAKAANAAAAMHRHLAGIAR